MLGKVEVEARFFFSELMQLVEKSLALFLLHLQLLVCNRALSKQLLLLIIMS
jgi:hypothetical protein